eukprot:scaffold21270_cov122-Amphora_coffeaeformis.AAC.1
MKGAIGRQYDISTTLAMVYDRLLAQFERLKSQEGSIYVDKVIKKCAKRCEDLWESVQQVDRQAEHAEDESQDSTS